MLLPIATVVMPTDLLDALNGKLTDSVLVSRQFPGHGSTSKAHHLGLRAFDALAAGCRDGTGFELTVSGPADAYRDFDNQLKAFKDRYREVSHGEFLNAPKTRRQYDGRFFVLKDPKAFALASPGRSNHGWGLAFDLAVFRNGKVEAVRSSGAWDWVFANAERFGFSWELQSEPHHVRLVTGDELPDAVREHGGDAPVTRGIVTPPSPPTPPATEPDEPALIFDAPPADPFDLGLGVDDPHRVRWLQAILNEREWGSPAVSGTFDAATEEAVKTMQRRLGVNDDGRYGRNTALALASFLSRAAA